MSCEHCGAVEQGGRFCVGCGKRMPPSLLPPRPVRGAARPAWPLDDADTQPVLRLAVHPRRAQPEESLPTVGA